MKINVDRSFLEINSISDLNRSKSPGSNFKITEVDPPDFHLNKFFYKQIGRKHRWIDRLTWGDKKWIEYVENPRIKNGMPIPIATMNIIAPPISNQSPIEMSIEVDISAKKMLHSFLDVGMSRADESRIKCLENEVGIGVQRV